MSESMVEKVAGELRTKALVYGEPFEPEHPIWSDLARAAIAAMMEPTLEMLERALPKVRYDAAFSEVTKADCEFSARREAYRAMITAALSNTEAREQ